jgi:hypothetical protein
MPLGNVASVGEMFRDHVKPPRVEQWMSGTADYAADQRGIFLLYSHSYDFLYRGYGAAMSRFLDRVRGARTRRRLRTTNMVDMSTFMDRFVATTSSFTRSADGVHVELANQNGLRDIAFAVPTAWINAGALPAGLHKAGTQRTYTILSVESNDKTFDATLPGGSPS